MNDIRRGVIIISGRRRVGVHIIYFCLKAFMVSLTINLISLLPPSHPHLPIQLTQNTAIYRWFACQYSPIV